MKAESSSKLFSARCCRRVFLLHRAASYAFEYFLNRRTKRFISHTVDYYVEKTK